MRKRISVVPCLEFLTSLHTVSVAFITGTVTEQTHKHAMLWNTALKVATIKIYYWFISRNSLTCAGICLLGLHLSELWFWALWWGHAILVIRFCSRKICVKLAEFIDFKMILNWTELELKHGTMNKNWFNTILTRTWHMFTPNTPSHHTWSDWQNDKNNRPPQLT